MHSKRLSPILDGTGKRIEVDLSPQSRFDAARTTNENRKHWAAADSLGPVSAHNADIRRTLRNRSRSEFGNNSYAWGLATTYAYDLIVTGPNLQVAFEDKSLNRAIESRFGGWSNAVSFASRLIESKLASVVDGECFGLLTNNDLLEDEVKLDFVPIETDYVGDPSPLTRQGAVQGGSANYPTRTSSGIVDGIQYDRQRNPVAYHVYNEHPGDAFRADYGGTWVPARSVIHVYKSIRPGQLRGIPEFTPALPLFAQMRRYTLSVAAAAEVASDIAGVLETDQIPNEDDVQLVPDFDTQEIARRTLLSLPPTYKLNQLKAEQPTTTYPMWKRELISEIARVISMPYAIAAGDSSDSSYASGRLEFQSWQISLKVERVTLWVAKILERVFAAWYAEAVRIPGYLPSNAPLSYRDVPHSWFWPNRPHVDPSKEAVALEKLLNVNGTSLAKYHAANGDDWEDIVRQRARERALEKELGVEPTTKAATIAAPQAEDGEDESNPVPPSRGLIQLRKA